MCIFQQLTFPIMKFLVIFSLFFCLQFVFAGNNPAVSFAQPYKVASAPKPKVHKQDKPPIFEGFSKNVLIAGASLLAYYGIGLLSIIAYVALFGASLSGIMIGGIGTFAGIIIGLLGLVSFAALICALVFSIKALRKDFAKGDTTYKGYTWAVVIMVLSGMPLLGMILQFFLALAFLILSMFL